MSDDSTTDNVELEEDPVYRHCLREMRLILGLWLICFIYTVTFCYCRGYLTHEPLAASTGPDIAELLGPLPELNREPASVTYPLGLGIPDWVFYGIVLPWLFCILASLYFCAFIFVEDELSDSTQQDGGSE